jgi:hypothetical protein
LTTSQPNDARSNLHLPTVLAVGQIAYILSDTLHEAVGHGGACLLVGGVPLEVSSVHFECNDAALSANALRVVSAGGSSVNLIVGLIAFALLARAKGPHARYFTWLFASVNLLQAGGYLMVSPLLGRFGDWDAFSTGLPRELAVRIALTLFGLGISLVTVRRCARDLAAMVGDSADTRKRRALWLTLGPYLAGGLSSCVAGLFNPVGAILVFMSALMSTLGGTAWLAWAPAWMPKPQAGATGEAMPIPRGVGWMIAAGVTVVVFVAVFGPGVKLGHAP